MKSLKEYSLNLPENEYHQYPAWSYSVIARYAKDGFSAIPTLHDPITPTDSMEFGSLFDSILTRGKKTLDEYVVNETDVPNAEKKALDYILTCTTEHFDDLSPEFVTTLCDQCQYQSRLKAETRYQKLSAYKDYYETRLSGKKMVSKDDWDDALEMARVFRNDPYLKTIFGTKNTEDVEYIYQPQFCEDYMLDSGKTVQVKIMPDLLIVDHHNQTIQPVDLKTSTVPGWNFKENFLKYRYDIQAHVYSDILALVLNKDPEYCEYGILPYLFTDISRSDKVPVTWVYPQNDESQANGFAFSIGDRTYTYKSWQTLLDEILAYEESKAKVPSYIRLDGPNDLLSILGK